MTLRTLLGFAIGGGAGFLIGILVVRLRAARARRADTNGDNFAEPFFVMIEVAVILAAAILFGSIAGVIIAGRLR